MDHIKSLSDQRAMLFLCNVCDIIPALENSSLPPHSAYVLSRLSNAHVESSLMLVPRMVRGGVGWGAIAGKKGVHKQLLVP